MEVNSMVLSLAQISKVLKEFFLHKATPYLLGCNFHTDIQLVQKLDTLIAEYVQKRKGN